MRLVDERMKGGAVREERSPVKEETDYHKLGHLLGNSASNKLV